MVIVKIGDLFDSDAQTLVNTVNCVGVMGKGVALEFKNRFPDMHEDYVARCNAGQVRLGRPYLYRSLVPPWVLNFPTKDHWRSVSRLQDIQEGLALISTVPNSPNIFRLRGAWVKRNGGTRVCSQTRAWASVRRPTAKPPAVDCASACLPSPPHARLR